MVDRNQFDLDDFGDLDNPSFTDDSPDFLPPDNTGGDAPRRNTTFVILMIALALLVICGIGGAAFFIIKQTADSESNRLTAVAIELTNNAVGTAIKGTIIAKSWTPTPSPTPTDTPTETPTLTPTPTDTPIPSETPTQEVISLSDVDMTNTAIAFDQANVGMTQTACASNPAVCAPTSGIPTLTPSPTLENAGGALSAVDLTNTAIALNAPGTLTVDQLTQTAAAGKPTATPNVALTATAKALAQTGFFEDLAGGKASPANIALVVLAGFGLLGIIFASRKLRIQ